MLGMTLALRMARAGWSVTLYEEHAQLGGLAAQWQLGGVTWDRHPQVMLRSDSLLLRLLRLMRLEREIEWRAVRTNIFVDGEMHAFTSPLDLLRFPAMAAIDKARLALMVRRADRGYDEDDLEQIGAEQWLREECGDRVFETLWRPLLLANFGAAYGRCNAAFVSATIARLRAAALRRGAPRFGYVRGGYATIVDALSRALISEDVRIRTATTVEDIRYEGRQLWIETSEGGGGRLYDRVIMTIPAPSVARVATALSGEERDRLRAIEYQGVVCPSMLLDQPLGNTYSTAIADPQIPFSAAVEMTALVDPSSLGNRHLVYLPRYCTPRDSFFVLGDAQLRMQATLALSRMYPSFKPETIRAFRVSRVPAAFALPLIAYSGRVPGFITSCPGLYIATSAQIVTGTPNVNATLALAHEAAAAIAQDPRYTGGGIRETAP